MYMPPKKKPKVKKAKLALKQRQSQVQNVNVNVSAPEKAKRKRKARAKKSSSLVPASGASVAAASGESVAAVPASVFQQPRYIYPTEVPKSPSDSTLLTDEMKAYLKRLYGGAPVNNLNVSAIEGPKSEPKQITAPTQSAPTQSAPRDEMKARTSRQTRQIQPRITILDFTDDDDVSSIDVESIDLSRDNLVKKKKKVIIRDSLKPEITPPVKTSEKVVGLNDKMAEEPATTSPRKTRGPNRTKEQIDSAQKAKEDKRDALASRRAADAAMQAQVKDEKRIARETKTILSKQKKLEKAREKKLGPIPEGF